MRPFLKQIVFSLSLLITINSYAQQNIERIDSLAGRFIKNLRREYSEKLLVQTNKNVFVAGEDLWMKAWVINHLSHKYYKHSQTLYVDIVNEQDSVFAKLLLNIPSEKTEARIPLTDKMQEGQYWLRLYTANMVKRDTGSIMVIPVYVINLKLPKKNANAFNNLALGNTNTTTLTSSNNTMPKIELFPEGWLS